MTVATLHQMRDEIRAKQEQLKAIFLENTTDDGEYNLSDDQVKEVQRRDEELNDLGAAYEQARKIAGINERNSAALQAAEEQAGRPGDRREGAPAPQVAGHSLYTHPTDGAEQQEDRRTVGQRFIQSESYRQARQRAGLDGGGTMNFSQFSVNLPDVNVRTLLAESAGFAPQAIRTGVVVPSAQQLPKVVDIIPATTTEMTAVVYMLETTFTNAAAAVAEGGTYPEAALAYTEQNSPVRKISVFIPVTDEQLADVPGMEGRINNRLTLMLRQRLDAQVLTGSGVAPNLTGLLNTAGIQTTARGTNPAPDALLTAATLVESVGFANPDYIVMHPTDWQNLRLLRSTTGEYIFGAPNEVVAPTIWGLTVVTSTYETLGTALVGDFATYSELDFRAGLEFEVSNSHSTFFVEGKLAIRAQLRAALVVYRPVAFCTATGL